MLFSPFAFSLFDTLILAKYENFVNKNLQNPQKQSAKSEDLAD